jgi:hypothetical protein
MLRLAAFMVRNLLILLNKISRERILLYEADFMQDVYLSVGFLQERCKNSTAIYLVNILYLLACEVSLTFFKEFMKQKNLSRVLDQF